MLKIFEKNRPNNLRSASWNWLLCVAVVAPRYNFHGFYSDGLIPSCPLHGMRHVMSELAYRSHHRCSNLRPATGFYCIDSLSFPCLASEYMWHVRQSEETWPTPQVSRRASTISSCLFGRLFSCRCVAGNCWVAWPRCQRPTFFFFFFVCSCRSVYNLYWT